jgi:hypothetical protein
MEDISDEDLRIFTISQLILYNSNCVPCEVRAEAKELFSVTDFILFERSKLRPKKRLSTVHAVPSKEIFRLCRSNIDVQALSIVNYSRLQYLDDETFPICC